MTHNDRTKIVNAARDLIAANERRGQGDSITPNERRAIEDLERAIAEARSAV